MDAILTKQFDRNYIWSVILDRKISIGQQLEPDRSPMKILACAAV
jgi:hypothetical protein